MTKPKHIAPIEPLLYDIIQTCTSLNIGRTKLYSEMNADEIEWVEIGDRRFTTEEQRRDYIQRKIQRRKSPHGRAA